jgi:hypothetical protein
VEIEIKVRKKRGRAMKDPKVRIKISGRQPCMRAKKMGNGTAPNKNREQKKGIKKEGIQSQEKEGNVTHFYS